MPDYRMKGDSIAPALSGGLRPSRISTGTTGVIKATPGQVFLISVQNANAAVRYMHLYDMASAPTIGTHTPVASIPLKASDVRDIPIIDLGVEFLVGIAWSFTTDDIAIPAAPGASGELHATVFYA